MLPMSPLVWWRPRSGGVRCLPSLRPDRLGSPTDPSRFTPLCPPLPRLVGGRSSHLDGVSLATSTPSSCPLCPRLSVGFSVFHVTSVVPSSSCPTQPSWWVLSPKVARLPSPSSVPSDGSMLVSWPVDCAFTFPGCQLWSTRPMVRLVRCCRRRFANAPSRSQHLPLAVYHSEYGFASHAQYIRGDALRIFWLFYLSVPALFAYLLSASISTSLVTLLLYRLDHSQLA